MIPMPAPETAIPTYWARPGLSPRIAKAKIVVKKDLGLEQQGTEPRRHAELHAEEQQRHLDRALGQAEAQGPVPGDRRRAEEDQYGQCGGGDAEPGHHQGRQGVEQLSHDHEGEAPQYGDGESERDVGDGHGATASRQGRERCRVRS